MEHLQSSGADNAAGGPAGLATSAVDMEMHSNASSGSEARGKTALPQARAASAEPAPQMLGREFFIGEEGSVTPSPRGDEFAEANAYAAEDEARMVANAKLVSVISLVASFVAAWFGIFIGIQDATLSLVGFGMEAFLDAISSVLVLWRFKTPKLRQHKDEEAAARFKAARDATRERNSGIGIGATFVCSSALLLSSAAYKLMSFDAEGHVVQEQDGANWTILLSLPSAVVFGALAMAKFRLAQSLDSQVLRKDALCSLLGAVLALICAVAGLAEQASGSAESMVAVDSMAGALIALILLFEGSKMLWHNLGTGWQEEHQELA